MAFQPMPLSLKPAPFDHPEWVFELKYDGFRSLAVIHDGRCELISRNGNLFNAFKELQRAVTSPYPGRTVIDGEIVCLDKRGKPQFRDLLFHRGEPCFFAFDLLMSDGQDLRLEKLTDRKQELRRLLSKVPASRMLYADHVEQYGIALFKSVCKMNLEGIVAKHSFGPYTSERERTTWFKIRNPKYSQMEGREELFERERHNEPAPGWHSCDLACAEND
jgi:bifunctional non-homologous end joining protein LigD